MKKLLRVGFRAKKCYYAYKQKKVSSNIWKHGAAAIVPEDPVFEFIMPHKIFGRTCPLPFPWTEEGGFVFPYPLAENLIFKAKSNRDFEEALSIKPGSWEHTRLYLIHIMEPGASYRRAPTPQSAGANSDFIPGGKTKGGIEEGFISPVNQFDIGLMGDGELVTINNFTIKPIVPGMKMDGGISDRIVNGVYDPKYFT